MPEISPTLIEDLASNAILGIVLVIYFCARDLCKRIAHSDCNYDENGLQVRLPTWHDPTAGSGGDPGAEPSVI